MSVRLVAFDLDGTLVDSAPDIARAVDRMMRELGLPMPGAEQVGRWVGDGATRLIKRALTGSEDGEPEAALLGRGLELFRRAYAEHVYVDSRLYPGTRETLDELKGRYRLACITNKPGQFTAPLLKAVRLDGYFDLVLSGDTLAALKPDPLPLLHAAENFGLKPAACCMVGDSRNDVLAARAAGFRAVALSHGYHQGDDLLALGAEILLASLAELPAWLAGTARTR